MEGSGLTHILKNHMHFCLVLPVNSAGGNGHWLPPASLLSFLNKESRRCIQGTFHLRYLGQLTT